jgi:glutamate 5-kinase
MKSLIVVKIGTGSIVEKGAIQTRLLNNIASEVHYLTDNNYNFIIVSSGAIACGKKIAPKGLDNDIYAGIGQIKLMNHWQKSFAKFGFTVAQALYISSNLRQDDQRKSIVKKLKKLLASNIIPIVNENDLISDEEINDLEGFGDNDQLASLLAQAMNANVLFFLTNVNGVIDPESRKIINKISVDDEEIEKRLETWPGDSKGGIRSKVKSAKDFVKTRAGSRAIIASHKEIDILIQRIIYNSTIGTEIS